MNFKRFTINCQSWTIVMVEHKINLLMNWLGKLRFQKHNVHAKWHIVLCSVKDGKFHFLCKKILNLRNSFAKSELKKFSIFLSILSKLELLSFSLSRINHWQISCCCLIFGNTTFSYFAFSSVEHLDITTVSVNSWTVCSVRMCSALLLFFSLC